MVLGPEIAENLRFGVSYRNLIAMTVRDIYPLLRTDDCIDSLRDASIFFTVHCSREHWHIETLEENGDEITFSSHRGSFQLVWIPLRLKNVSASFMRAVDIIPSRPKCYSAMVYLVNIIV